MKDFLLGNDGDLLIQDGDFVIGDSTIQNQKLLFVTKKGEWRQNIGVGIGAIDYINDDALADLSQEIQKQFEADGMRVKKVSVMDDGAVSWDAEY